MKRVRMLLSLLVSIVLVAGLAFEAKAESPITFSGYLRLRAFLLEGFFPTVKDADSRSDKYAISRLRININFKPTDYLEVRWRIHAPHAARFGSTTADDFYARSYYFYGVVKTEYGTLSAGRVSYDIDSAGLQTLGYMPAWGFNATGNVFDRDGEVDGILYRNDWENGFGLKAFYVKFRTPTNVQVATVKDGDYDRFSVEPYYKWAGGGVSFAIQYDRNQYLVDSNNLAAGFYDKNYFVSFNPAFAHTFPLGGDKSLSIHAEAKISRGKVKTEADEKEIDQEGTGAYLDFTYNYPSGDASLAGWWFDGGVSGPGAPRETKRRGVLDPGEGFYPFMIFYYGNNFLLGGGDKSLEGFQTPNHWALSILGNHKITKDATLNYGAAYFSKTRDFIKADGKAASKSLGTEFNLGLVVNILQNLQWSSKVGVFAPGKYYNESTGRDDLDKTIWGWANEFLFTF